MKLDKIHPKVEFPVSRGTPMISPLLQWDHSESFFVTNFEDSHKSERSYFINISEEFDYIHGHTIDGRVLFPATGYLYLVWHSFADMCRVKMEDCDIEIEDVKFMRATTMVKGEDIQLDVVVNRGTGNFEINEGSSVVVKGTIRSAVNIKLSELKDPNENNRILMGNKDFYKELRLRGYNYNGLFRSVVTARADGLKAEIQWSKNWIAFLDCMLQIQIIGRDTRSLILPVSLRKLVIKPKEHLEFISTLEARIEESEDKIVPCIASEELHVVRCGGIEMRGMTASRVVRRRPPGVPVLESYTFVPHLPTPKITPINFARFCVQLMTENNPLVKYTVVEVDGEFEKLYLSDQFAQALGDLPLITGEFNFLSQKTPEFTENIKIADSQVNAFNNINCLIQNDILSNVEINLTAIRDHLSDISFVVSREPISTDNRNILQYLPEDFKIISISSFEDEMLVIIKYQKNDVKIPSRIIQITPENYDWLDDLKASVKEGPVIAISQNNPLSGLIGLANCIRKEPNGLNLRCVFIDDPKAPPFDIQNNFYRLPLEQGLGINVYRNGKWGSYRHFTIKDDIVSVPVRRSDHCYANCLLRGDLSSMTWLDGSYNYVKLDPSSITKIQYASLNFRDVMLATGKLQDGIVRKETERIDEQCVLGFEFAGIRNSDNTRIMGMVQNGSMATHIVYDPNLSWEVPNDWTLEQAATVPVVYT
jgi:fatty acid synthase, animal type